MFVSIFAIDFETKEKVFRSTRPLSQIRINNFINEFANETLLSEGIIEKETYDYVYTSYNIFYYVAQIDKFTFKLDAFRLLNYIKSYAGTDIYDVLFYIDNLVYDNVVVFDNIPLITSMESQDEKIHMLLLKSQQLEMERKAKEYKKKIAEEEMMARYREAILTTHGTSVTQESINAPNKEKKKTIIEKSSMPVLIILKEKVNIQMDKENFVRTNQVIGEMSIVIFDVKYKNIRIKMKNLTNNCKYSPYLDKDALSKSIFKFENEKQLNKNIHLFKWSGKIKELPITFEYWIDEDNGCFSGVITFSAKRNIQDLRVSIPTHGMSNFETENHRDIVDNNIILLVGNINANESKTIEIKYIAADLKAIFPLSLSFVSDLETQLSIERIYLEENEINDYEFRKLMEVEMYDIIDN